MVTVTDVAKKAGVSTSTVSRVLSDSGYASARTRSAVLSAAKALGYVPNAIARGLKTQKSGFIAFIMPEVIDPYFFATVARGVEEIANSNGFQILLGNNDDNQLKERNYIELMVASAIEGMIITPSVDSRTAYRILADRGIPIVFVDRVVGGFGADTVRSDDYRGAKLLVDHLASLGHRRVALVNGHSRTSVAMDRAAGFKNAVVHSGLDLDERLISWGPWVIEDAERRVNELVESGAEFSAIIAGNLYMAIGTLRALRRQGLRVPEDVALVSFNDLELAAEINPFLTVLSQPIYSLGRIAMGLLLDRINGKYSGEPRDVVLSPSLVVRESCGAKLKAFDRNLRARPDVVDAK
jgi:LacI family transcriptional regulator